jgi:hypothetical protein
MAGVAFDENGNPVSRDRRERLERRNRRTRSRSFGLRALDIERRSETNALSR